MAEGEDGAAVPKEQKGSWMSFLKQIASFSGDLSSLTAPSFILSPTSLVEFSAYWGEPDADFANIATGKSPEERCLLVLKWFILTLKGQYTRRETTTGSEKSERSTCMFLVPPLAKLIAHRTIQSRTGGSFHWKLARV